MTQLHTPPELSPRGAQLLADVLAQRQVPHSEPLPQPTPAPPRRGLPIVVGLMLGAAILAGALAVVSTTERADVEVLGAVETAVTPSAADLDQLDASITNVSPRINDVQSFSLLVTAGSVQFPIELDELRLSVEDSTGRYARTFVRFEQATLGQDASAAASVRVEGIDSADFWLVLRSGNTEIDRISLG